MAKKSTHPIVRVFFRGLGVIVPLAITVFAITWLWNTLARHIVGRAEQGVTWVVTQLAPEGRNADDLLPPQLRLGVAIVATIALILVAGWWFSGFFGRRIYRGFEKLLARTPVIGAIYPHVKQITEFFFAQDGEKKIEFERVVALPYPRKGLWSLGLVTGSSLRSINAGAGDTLVSVFIPSSPMPATGYTIFVPASDLVPVAMSVDEALRTIISAGVLVPDQESVATPALGTSAPRALPDAGEPA
ncbi:MAG TPA: DUF502 domain-containing protein [Planctomycetota bacterium]